MSGEVAPVCPECVRSANIRSIRICAESQEIIGLDCRLQTHAAPHIP